MHISLVFFVVLPYIGYTHGVPTDGFELPKTDITSDTQLQGDTKCYLRAKVQCAKDVELQLMIGDVFTDPEFVEASNNESAPSYKCLPAPCTRDGKVVGNIVVIGNEITVEPELLKDLKAYTSEDECDMAKGDEHFEVTCNDEEFFQNEIQDSQADMQWHNEYDKSLKVECSNQEGMYRVKSKHSNKKEDRKWEWHCRRVAMKNFGKTTWKGYVNDFDKPMFFNCPVNHFICGVKSHHKNSKEDRRWKFKCCQSPYHYTRNCGLSEYVNDWDRPMDYTVPSNGVITGAYSYHSNSKEDRRWKFSYCEYKYCKGVM